MTIRRTPVSPSAVAVAAALAIGGYVLGVATSPRTAPTPTGSAAAAVPTSTLATSIRTSVPSRLPSNTPATAEPTGSPPWAWRRTTFPLDQYLMVQGVWGLEDRVVGLAAYYESWYVPWFNGDTGWPMSPAPTAISLFWTGTVVDERLWFLARDEGLRPKETSLRLVGTDGDENAGWKALGPSDLDPDSSIRFLGKINDVWVAAYIGEGGNIEIGAPQYIRTSRDGIQWSDPRVPTLRGVDPFGVGFHDAQATREFIVVLVSIHRSGATQDLLLVSRDGVEWREVSPPDRFDWPTDIACNETTCVMTRYAFENHPVPYPLPIAWISTDGVIWTPSETVLGDESAGTGLRYVAATNDGFVGIEGEHSTVAWISGPDGLTWTRHEVLPPALKVPIIDLAVSGDTVVALEQEPDNEPQGAWVGSLAAMRSRD